MEKLSTNPAQWILAPVQNIFFKIIGFFWATIWGLVAVNEFPYFEDLPVEFLVGHIMAFFMWPMCIASPLTLPAVFIAGYIFWSLIYDIHPAFMLFLILGLMSSWVSFVFSDFQWNGGWHSIPMLGIPLFLAGWVSVAKVQEIVRTRND